MGRVEVHPKDESGIDLITALPQTIRIYILRGEEEKKDVAKTGRREEEYKICAKFMRKKGKNTHVRKKRQNRTSMLSISNR